MLRDDKFENDLNTAIANTKIEVDQLHNIYVYSDIDNGRQNPTLKLLSAIDNIKSKTMLARDTVIPIITYHSKCHLIFFND